MLSEEEVREDLAKVSAAAHHLLDLVNGVLDISRAQSGKFVLSYEHVELGALFRNVAHYIHSMVNHDACTFSVQTPPQPVWGEVDIMRLRQVILNLLSNAVKFTERGSIATRLWVEEDDFLVEVVDTGPGITQDKWLTIFEPFERLDMHNSLIDGTGTWPKFEPPPGSPDGRRHRPPLRPAPGLHLHPSPAPIQGPDRRAKGSRRDHRSLPC